MASTPRVPELRWALSKGSSTSERGWAGNRQLFSIIDRGYELALHPRLPGGDGFTLPEEIFQSDERDLAHARAQQMWEQFLVDVLSRSVQASRAS